jgi:hypothetical protein
VAARCAQESNADKAIKALTSALAPKAKVLRDGKINTIEASELVPGDVIIARLGDIVPADIKVGIGALCSLPRGQRACGALLAPVRSVTHTQRHPYAASFQRGATPVVVVH